MLRLQPSYHEVVTFQSLGSRRFAAHPRCKTQPDARTLKAYHKAIASPHA